MRATPRRILLVAASTVAVALNAALASAPAQALNIAIDLAISNILYSVDPIFPNSSLSGTARFTQVIPPPPFGEGFIFDPIGDPIVIAAIGPGVTYHTDPILPTDPYSPGHFIQVSFGGTLSSALGDFPAFFLPPNPVVPASPPFMAPGIDLGFLAAIGDSLHLSGPVYAWDDPFQVGTWEITITAVPEPVSLLLFAAGLGGLALGSRRIKRRCEMIKTNMTLVVIAAAALYVIGATFAANDAVADVITFSGDSPGVKPNGFSSADSNNVSFADTIGANLEVGDFSPQTNGNGLLVRHDLDASRLEMTFSQLYNYLSIAFGNDDPNFSDAGDLAWLRLFNGATLVGTASTVMNRNDVIDQTVAFSGPAFDRAEFYYGNAAEDPINLTEAVDNITFTALAVPEPATLALLGSSLLGLAVFRHRRKTA